MKLHTFAKWLLGIVFAVAVPGAAYACPDGYYNACVLGACACMPNGGTVEKHVNPLPDVLKVGDAVVNGNVGEINRSVGAIVIKAACLGCQELSKNLSAQDKAFAEQVVGRGFILLASGVDANLVVAVAATSVAQYLSIKAKKNPLAPEPPIAVRGPKTYETSKATCLIKNTKTNEVVAGWKNALTIRDKATGTSSTYPQILDLQRNDILEIKSDLCPEQNDPNTGMVSVDSLVVVYAESNSLPGGPEQMKYFVLGKVK